MYVCVCACVCTHVIVLSYSGENSKLSALDLVVIAQVMGGLGVCGGRVHLLQCSSQCTPLEQLYGGGSSC